MKNDWTEKKLKELGFNNRQEALYQLNTFIFQTFNEKEIKDSFRNLLLFGRNERYVNTETKEITNITNYQITCDCNENI